MRWNFRNNKLEKSGLRDPIYRNPRHVLPQWKNFIFQHFSELGWFLLLAILLLVYLFYFSPIFAITNVEITGVGRPTAGQISEKYVNWQLSQKRFKIFPQKNLLAFDTGWLEENITNNFFLDTLEITKKPLHKLTITLKEKSPELIWQSSDKYYYLDATGQLSGLIASDQVPANIPIITDESSSDAAPGQQIVSQEKNSFILRLMILLKELNDLEITGISTPHPISPQINISVKDGYKIYFDQTKDLDSQSAKLERILNGSEGEIKPSEYLDLRIGDRIYYK